MLLGGLAGLGPRRGPLQGPRLHALLAPARAGLPVAEYAPNAVKKVVVGVGHAEKAQVAHMVRLQLPGVARTSTMVAFEAFSKHDLEALFSIGT